MQSEAKLAKSQSAASTGLWQHPFVDLFKHFKVGADWRQTKKQGDVQETFVRRVR